MLKKRVIPCLLLKNQGLVKTVKFGSETYIGDPINAVRIFNTKEADELIFLDIEASIKAKKPDLKLLKDIASECFMPLCFGGGISDFETAKQILRLGIEKVSFNTAVYSNPDLIRQSAASFGSQAVVASIDIKKDFLGRYKAYILSGTKEVSSNILEYLKYIERLGAGEILINDIDRDGTMKGLDLKLLKIVSSAVSVPVIAMGGVGSLDDISFAFKNSGISAIAAGSLFVYHGRTKGILISYPSQNEFDKIVK